MLELRCDISSAIYGLNRVVYQLHPGEQRTERQVDLNFKCNETQGNVTIITSTE